MARLIALYSAVPGSGKSTAAQMLADHGWVIEPFAAPLKRMAASLLHDAGYSEDATLDILSTNKGQPLSLLAGAPTARHLLQTLGTAWGRESIHPELWIRLWASRVREALEAGRAVVCDDMRTLEEAETVRALGGELWRIKRPRVAVDGRTIAHSTEGALNDLEFDRTITNDGTLQRLEAAVLQEVAA